MCILPCTASRNPGYRVSIATISSFHELGFTQDSMVEGLHPNDLGMRQFADAYLRKLRKIPRHHSVVK
ncbi:MAG: hypothetical protein K6F47_05955 [Bacteroidaceae bacterium]|nr:hypothetical protein [Bacteroidaceae bacterium]